MRQVRFLPFGFEFSEFGLRELRLARFLTFFDFRFVLIYGFVVLHDERCPVFPLKTEKGRKINCVASLSHMVFMFRSVPDGIARELFSLVLDRFHT